MRIVVDASVIVSALVDSGRDGRWAEAEIAGGGLAAPELAPAEASNMRRSRWSSRGDRCHQSIPPPARRLEQAGELSRLEAASAHRDLLRLEIDLYPFAPFAERVWALRSNLTCYDAWYVAMAEALACPLMTLDRRLGRATGPRCPFATPPQGR